MKPKDNKRSDKWPEVRKAFLKGKVCACCGGNKCLQAHHVVAFHADISKELDPTNLVALCEGTDRDCHRLFGHLGNYQSINENVREDAEIWRNKVTNRPKWDGE